MTTPAHKRMYSPIRPCKAEPCNKPNAFGTAYCYKHLSKAQQYGDPFGKALHRTEYAAERQEVLALISTHRHHDAARIALHTLNQWLTAAKSHENCPGALEIHRLATAGVTAEDILIEATAVYAYSSRNPGVLEPRSDLLTYQLANAILRLAPRKSKSSKGNPHAIPKNASVRNRRAIGAYLRELLDPFYYGHITHGGRPHEQTSFAAPAGIVRFPQEPTWGDLWAGVTSLPRDILEQASDRLWFLASALRAHLSQDKAGNV